MRLKTQLAIKQDIEAMPPRAWNRKDFENYLAERRTAWNAPKYLTPNLLINFLVDNEIAHERTISSKEYGRKVRYVTGDVPLLRLVCAFYKDSYLSHSTALHVHGLTPMGKIFVNHEQSPKTTTTRLSQARIDRAFQNQPRRSSFEFQMEQYSILFLNGKHTGNAGVTTVEHPSAGTVRVTSLERTLIDCAVRPQYAGGIEAVAALLPDAYERISPTEIARLLAKTKYAYPYHQSIGFLLERAGMPSSALEPLRQMPRRFKLYLDYGIKRTAYNASWQVYYPSNMA